MIHWDEWVVKREEKKISAIENHPMQWYNKMNVCVEICRDDAENSFLIQATTGRELEQ